MPTLKMARVLPLLLLAGTLGCAGIETGRPLIILVSFDTFRADAISRSLTPNLVRLAGDSVTFENAFIPYPQTLTSHMSLLTGLYPGAHGVYPKNGRLTESIPSLPALLRAAGYRTVGLVTSEWLKGEFGFARGFDRYERLPHEATYADRVNAAALEELDPAATGEAPLFLFLHYYDAHSDFQESGSANLPYYSPPEYRAHLDEVAEDEFCDGAGKCSTHYLMDLDKTGAVVSPDRVEKIFELYRAGIRALDDAMGRFFRELELRGLYEGALIIVTSDHGEEFREHGRFIHSQPYRETVSVPLMIKFPGSWMAGRRVADVVESIDILPTVLDYLGIEAPGHLQGENLMRLVGGKRKAGGAVLAQDGISFSRYSIRSGDYNFIVNLKSGGTELYDLGSDPEEAFNIAEERPDLVSDLRQKLALKLRTNRQLLKTLGAGVEVTEEVLSESERENLEALGYLN